MRRQLMERRTGELLDFQLSFNHLLALHDHRCLQYRYFLTLRSGPQLPSPLPVPILPQVHPHLTEVICDTKLVHLPNGPFSDTSWCGVQVTRNEGMCAEVALDHVDNV